MWAHPAGLFVVGYPKDSIVKYAYSTSAEAVVAEIVAPVVLFAANILLILILFWRNTHRVEKAVKPILTGINTMAQGKPVSLPERGELAEINAELNRASKLEYSMQPATKALISPVELVRQVMSDFINNGLEEQFVLDLHVDAGAEKIIIEGDNALLVRMLENLIQNSVSHNPDGCNISITVGADEYTCIIKVKDTGSGVSEPLLARLNTAEITPSAQNENGEAAHGMGLKSA